MLDQMATQRFLKGSSRTEVGKHSMPEGETMAEDGRGTATTAAPSSCAPEPFRQVMRQLSFPVSVLTVQLEDGQPHGATVSSLSSVALEPHPLISLSLRRPSRLASHLLRQPRQSFQVFLLNHLPDSIRLATIFSQPRNQIPFAAFHSLQQTAFACLHCHVLQSIDLSSLNHLTPQHHLHLSPSSDTLSGSTLFIARVLQSTFSAGNTQQQPLMYHNRSYTTIKIPD
ncbi:uncharacterized protein VP01_297g2 [Puccinia sorghi]|uniref:Flavin reductase like domain-containing protein n=1 Tax=Puccinia sorghi TaxID=27349 RepID=A0A0L6V0J7_9BASI|nr:uncharacterized protein VP01_297g2 [Puccinia sorghi]